MSLGAGLKWQNTSYNNLGAKDLEVAICNRCSSLGRKMVYYTPYDNSRLMPISTLEQVREVRETMVDAASGLRVAARLTCESPCQNSLETPMTVHLA